jgi:hypothetical protein
MNYEIHPLKGIGNIEFGMPVDKVRNLMSGKFETFRRIEYPEELRDKFPSDHYVDQGVFCYYDVDGHLEAMEFVTPARPFLGEFYPLEMSFREAATVLAKLDADIVRELGSVTSRRWSLSIYTPNRPSDPVGCFLAGRAGLYDELPE